MSILDRIEGSLFAGAVGDMHGAPVEIFSLETLLGKFGSHGVIKPVPYDPEPYVKRNAAPCVMSGYGVSTDDTCMSATNIAAALVALQSDQPPLRFFHQAYMRWGQYQQWAEGDYRSRLDPALVWPHWFDAFCFASGAGESTIRALNQNILGTPDHPIWVPGKKEGDSLRLSEGCGGIMRAAAMGWLAGLDYVDDVYAATCHTTALTHGAANAQTLSGATGVLTAALIKGSTWQAATQEMLADLRCDPRAKGLDAMMEQALLAGQKHGPHLTFTDLDVLPYQLNATPTEMARPLFSSTAVMVQVLAITAAAQTWAGTAEEKTKRALVHAATQTGDSDSVAAVVGNVLGAQWGIAAIPKDWRDMLQLKDALNAMMGDLRALAQQKTEKHNQLEPRTLRFG